MEVVKNSPTATREAAPDADVDSPTAPATNDDDTSARRDGDKAIPFELKSGFGDSQWKNMFDQLSAFQKTNGHCNVQSCENKTLHQWVSNQRRRFISNTLDAHQKRQLDSIIFDWTAPPETAKKITLDEKWKNRFDQLSEYQEMNGNCNVRACENKSLYGWIVRQRSLLCSNTLHEDRKRQLDSIGFEWTVLDATWKTKFDELSEYKEMNGHCSVRCCENKSLYSWVIRQRCLFDSNTLHEDRKKKLDSIGFEWATPPETKMKHSLDLKWKNMLDQLLDYREMNGHFNVRSCENNSLYTWVLRQRRQFDSNTLDEDRKRQLDSIGFEWTAPPETTQKDLLDATWKTKFDELSEYKEMNGHCSVRSCESGPLYKWTLKQRRQFDSNSLDEDRKKKLDSIGFEWSSSRQTTREDVSDAFWKNRFDELSEYRVINGHCNVRACENNSLYSWVIRQRCLFDSNSLDEDRKRQLDAIEFEWIAPPETKRKDVLDTRWKNELEGLSEVRRSRAPLYAAAKIRESKLSSTGFDKQAEPKPRRVVMTNEITRLQHFREIHGHCNVITEQDQSRSRRSDGDDDDQGNDSAEEDSEGCGYDHPKEGLADSLKRPRQQKMLSQPRRERKKYKRASSLTPDNQQSSLPTLSIMEARQKDEETDSTRLTRQDVQARMSESEKMFYIDKRVAKQFGGELFAGTIVSFRDADELTTYWKVEYDDGDSEEFDLEELKRFMAFFDSSLMLKHRQPKPEATLSLQS